MYFCNKICDVFATPAEKHKEKRCKSLIYSALLLNQDSNPDESPVKKIFLTH